MCEAIRPDWHCPSEQHVRALVSSRLVRDLFFSLPPGQQVHWLEIKVSFLDFVVLPVTKLMGGVCWNYCVCVSRLFSKWYLRKRSNFATKLGLVGALSRPGMLWGRNWFAIYKVKVTGCMSSKSYCFYCFLNFCSQT